MAGHRKALPVMASSTFVAIWTVWWAWHMWPNSGLSWHFSVDGARLLLQGSGLNLYADAHFDEYVNPHSYTHIHTNIHFYRIGYTFQNPNFDFYPHPFIHPYANSNSDIH